MPNEINYGQEDKVRALSPQDLARILILAFGSTDISGIKLLGKKTDGTYEVIKTDDAGSLLVKDESFSVTVYQFMDFWSDADNEIDLPAVAADVNLPDVVVSGLPTGITISRVVAVLKIRAIENTNAGGANAINGAQAIRVKKSTGTWGVNDIAAINLPDNLWTVAASTRESGDVMVGSIDLKSVVDGDGTYNFRFEDALVDFANLRLNDVLVGLRIYFTS